MKLCYNKVPPVDVPIPVKGRCDLFAMVIFDTEEKEQDSIRVK